MTKRIEVYWTPTPGHTNVKPAYVQVVTQEPENVLVKLARERNKISYVKCPALQNYLRNTFVITSPYTVQITTDKDTNTVFTDNLGQEFFDHHIFNRNDQCSSSDPFLLTIFPSILFYAKETVILEQQDSLVFSSEASRKFKVIPGSFDISKWLRPLELAIECPERKTVLPIKAGDPLFSVRFITKDNAPVKLVRVPFTEEIKQSYQACVQVKTVREKLKLPELYKLAENFLSLLKSK